MDSIVLACLLFSKNESYSLPFMDLFIPDNNLKARFLRAFFVCAVRHFYRVWGAKSPR